ncbi:unnamed protein product [Meloidogyne enterolobii]|uniref:Uncharacterized protein n=1 Tax=Meloidogyne enterolobii TaxID=390850 RepID=A0ACB0ZN90_MELEN
MSYNLYVKLLDLVVDVDVGSDVGVNVNLLIVLLVFFNILYYTRSMLSIKTFTQQNHYSGISTFIRNCALGADTI